MYAIKNKVQLIGNLGNAPDVHTTEKGKKRVRFYIATNDYYRNAKGEKIEETYWHQVIAWGRIADVAEKFLERGTEVAIEGRLIQNSYLDKDGNRRFCTEIQASEILLLRSRRA